MSITICGNTEFIDNRLKFDTLTSFAVKPCSGTRMNSHAPNVRINTKRARELFRIKAAKATHKAILAQGRTLCSEATAAVIRNAAARRAQKEREALTGRQGGNTLSDGTY